MQTDNFTLTLTVQQLGVINEGLQYAPFGKVAPLIAEINRQIAEQQKSDTTPPIEVTP